MRRRRWLANPDQWVAERLGEFVWSKQREILHSIRDHRKTAVPSCHGSGKSFVASRAVGWWLDCHPPGSAYVVTSATTAHQVRAVLWQEINQMQSKHDLPGRTNQTSWLQDITFPNGNVKELLVAFGRKPADMDPSALTGIHRRYVLVIFDEAGGIPGGTTEQPNSLWEAADSLTTGEDCRFLAIGNPDVPNSMFQKVCSPGSGYSVIHISAFDTPNFTGETAPKELRYLLTGPTWVGEKKRMWGEKNPLYIAKVLGQFPKNLKDGLIPMEWIRAAQNRDLVEDTPEEQRRHWTTELGVDVGAGGDKNVVCKKWGPVFRIIRRDHEPDTMVSCGNLIADLQETGASIAKVDYIGIGRGMVDRARELRRPVRGVNVGESPRNTEMFLNLRAEGYWALRERFQEGSIDIEASDSGDDLAAQLVEIRYQRASHGKIKIESKDDMKRRGLSSPDEADATMLSAIPEEHCGTQEVRTVRVALG